MAWTLETVPAQDWPKTTYIFTNQDPNSDIHQFILEDGKANSLKLVVKCNNKGKDIIFSNSKDHQINGFFKQTAHDEYVLYNRSIIEQVILAIHRHIYISGEARTLISDHFDFKNLFCDEEKLFKFCVSNEEIKTLLSDTRLGKNLRLGTQAIHYTQKYIEHSSTAPGYTKADTDFLCDHIEKMRMIEYSADVGLRAIYSVPNASDDLNWFLTKTETRNVKSYSKDAINVGNCHEFADFAIKYLRKCEGSLSGELYRFLDSSHLFAVYDKNPSASPNQIYNFGPTCVIVDGWAGKAYSASPQNILAHLKCWRRVNGINELFSFDGDNPNLSSMRKIGGNDFVRKNQAIETAICKLNWIKNAILQLNLIGQTVFTTLNHAITNEIANITHMSLSDIHNTKSHVDIERKFNHLIKTYLNKLLMQAREHNLQKEIESALIQEWITNDVLFTHSHRNEVNTVKQILIKMLLHYPNNILIPLFKKIKTMPEYVTILKQIVENTIFINGDDTYLDVALMRRNKKYFEKLAEIIEPSKITNMIKTPNFYHVHKNVRYGKITMLHCVVLRGWERSFNIMLDKIDPHTLYEIAQITSNGKNLLDFVKENLPQAAFDNLVSKLNLQKENKPTYSPFSFFHQVCLGELKNRSAKLNLENPRNTLTK